MKIVITNPKTIKLRFTSPLIIRSSIILLMSCLYFASGTQAKAAELNNGIVSLHLSLSSEGIPVIAGGYWAETGEPIFSDDGSIQDLGNWIPVELVNPDSKPTKWTIKEGRVFIHAEASRDLINGLKMTWVVDLLKQGSLFRLSVRVSNHGNSAQNVDWYPAWVGSWNLPEAIDHLRWWESLSYTPDEASADGKYRFSSRLHSSDILDGGVYPYWIVSTPTKQFFFGLEWCGGWEAKLNKNGSNLSFTVRLPGDETQLILQGGEAISGPVLSITPTIRANEASDRNSWMSQRLILAKSLYKRSTISFPLNYNPWFAIGFDVDATFLNNQIASMGPYNFDNFIFDAGWYERVGDWQPNSAKFQLGQFEDMISEIKALGSKVGIWSCPQYIAVDGDMPPQVDEPNHFESFIDGFLLDLADTNFKKTLFDHVRMLKNSYSIDWWKYDQPLFVEQSRAGAMKNVVAYQEALKTVSRANPDLSIEGCLNGGRMINELTALTSNILWLRDGQGNSDSKVHRNIEVNLGALEFLFPWQVYSWTNNINDLDPEDNEFLKFYCRSAMIGVWGISADLSKISEYQKQVVLKEIERYRILNQIKTAYTYDIYNPVSGDEAANVIYYDESQQRAAAIVFRWDAEGSFNKPLNFSHLDPDTLYLVRDVDRGKKTRMLGKDLMEGGYSVKFSTDRLSAIIFVDPI